VLQALSIAAHPENTRTFGVALDATFAAMLLVSVRVHALPFAAYLSEAAFLSTPPAVESVSGKLHTLVAAAIRPCTTFSKAYLRVLLTCQRHPLGKEPACSSERLWLFIRICRCC